MKRGRKLELLQYFNESNRDGILVFSFNSNDLIDLHKLLPVPFRRCFVTDEKLKSLLQNNNEYQNSEDLLSNIYIPDKPNIKAGDFGEMFGFFFLIDKYDKKYGKKLFGPQKWQYKDEKNKSAPKTDIVLFHFNDKPCADDLIVSAEVKVKSSDSRVDVIESAIKGAEKDYISRLAETLVWLRAKSIKNNTPERIEVLNRFIKSTEEKYGKYKKHIKAVVLVDSSFTEEELKKERTNIDIGDDFKILVLEFENLKNIYEFVYEQILKSYKDGNSSQS
jgi:hypothetical protein